jgi:hypothetical protein
MQPCFLFIRLLNAGQGSVVKHAEQSGALLPMAKLALWLAWLTKITLSHTSTCHGRPTLLSHVF